MDRIDPTLPREAELSVIDLRRRLDRIEAARSATTAAGILSDRPMDDDAAADVLVDWRILVAQGRASLSRSTLYVTSPELTESEWVAQHVTAH